ncbi:hypothetical protein [Neorickettsia risticii]|uniref:hypothetical protein n=1 Tax=Neorickettsia risticii TaxID=950 RepID=UPI00059CD56D|nr:hypothetical protein [Neorickettsia risticii]
MQLRKGYVLFKEVMSLPNKPESAGLYLALMGPGTPRPSYINCFVEAFLQVVQETVRKKEQTLAEALGVREVVICPGSRENRL